jgi:hypothetical protein
VDRDVHKETRMTKTTTTVRGQIRSIVGRWRAAGLERAEIERRAGVLAWAIADDVAHGADGAQGKAMLDELRAELAAAEVAA